MPSNWRLRERLLCPHLESPGRRKAAAAPRLSAARAAVAPPRAEPGLLPGSPCRCQTHTGTGGGRGWGGLGRRECKREWGAEGGSGALGRPLPSPICVVTRRERRPGCCRCCWVAQEGHLLVRGARARGGASRGGVEGPALLRRRGRGGGSAPARVM